MIIYINSIPLEVNRLERIGTINYKFGDGEVFRKGLRLLKTECFETYNISDGDHLLLFSENFEGILGGDFVTSVLKWGLIIGCIIIIIIGIQSGFFGFVYNFFGQYLLLYIGKLLTNNTSKLIKEKKTAEDIIDKLITRNNNIENIIKLFNRNNEINNDTNTRKQLKKDLELDPNNSMFLNLYQLLKDNYIINDVSIYINDIINIYKNDQNLPKTEINRGINDIKIKIDNFIKLNLENNLKNIYNNPESTEEDRLKLNKIKIDDSIFNINLLIDMIQEKNINNVEESVYRSYLKDIDNQLENVEKEVEEGKTMSGFKKIIYNIVVVIITLLCFLGSFMGIKSFVTFFMYIQHWAYNNFSNFCDQNWMNKVYRISFYTAIIPTIFYIILRANSGIIELVSLIEKIPLIGPIFEVTLGKIIRALINILVKIKEKLYILVRFIPIIGMFYSILVDATSTLISSMYDNSEKVVNSNYECQSLEGLLKIYKLLGNLSKSSIGDTSISGLLNYFLINFLGFKTNNITQNTSLMLGYMSNTILNYISNNFNIIDPNIDYNSFINQCKELIKETSIKYNLDYSENDIDNIIYNFEKFNENDTNDNPDIINILTDKENFKKYISGSVVNSVCFILNFLNPICKAVVNITTNKTDLIDMVTTSQLVGLFGIITFIISAILIGIFNY